MTTKSTPEERAEGWANRRCILRSGDRHSLAVEVAEFGRRDFIEHDLPQLLKMARHLVYWDEPDFTYTIDEIIAKAKGGV